MNNTAHQSNVIPFNSPHELTPVPVVTNNLPTEKLKFRRILAANKLDLEYMQAMLELYKGTPESDPDFVSVSNTVFNLRTKEEKDRKQLATKLLNDSSKKEIEWPDVILNDDGDVVKIKTTKANTEHLLVSKKGFSVKFNELKKEIDFDINQETLSADETKKQIESTDNSGFLFHCRDVCEMNNYSVPFDTLKQHIYLLSRENRYHPVKEYLRNLPKWDGHDYIHDLFNTITINEDHIDFIELFETFLRKWLVQAVFCMLCDNEKKFNAAGVLVFHGSQGKGKTTWMSRLSPYESWFKEGMTLDPKDKDDVALFIQHWIVELGEIDATFRKSDIAVLKSFITNNVDQFRPPYGASTQKYKRETVCCGSVNDMDFLKDDQNRRFWVISCSKIDAFHDVNMDMVWAQAKSLFEEGYSFYLNAEELARLHKSNENFRVISTVEDHMLELGISSKPTNILRPEENCHSMGIVEFFKRVLKLPPPNIHQNREFRRCAEKLGLKYAKNKRHYTFYYTGELARESSSNDSYNPVHKGRKDYDAD